MLESSILKIYALSELLSALAKKASATLCMTNGSEKSVCLTLCVCVCVCVCVCALILLKLIVTHN